MIQFRPAPPVVVIACEACGKPIDDVAAAVLVPWAGRTALACHRGECLAALRLQYPSTTGEAVVGLADAIEQLAGLLPAADTLTRRTADATS